MPLSGALSRPQPIFPVDHTTPGLERTTAAVAVAYQRMLHQLVRRELTLLADLSVHASDAARVALLVRHAELVCRVLEQHHSTERRLLWPALLRSLPDDVRTEAAAHVRDWTDRTDRIDAGLDQLRALACRWAAERSPATRAAFADRCAALACRVVEATGVEERLLVPLVGAHMSPADWVELMREAENTLSVREQMLVPGLALEDGSAGDRARIMVGLPAAARATWRLSGRREYRETVSRLRGSAPRD